MPNHDDAKRPSLQAQLASRPTLVWECPLCEAVAPGRFDTCPACGAILTLDDLDAALDNDDIDEGLVLDAIKRLEDRLRLGSTFTTHYLLGMAYLNLGQVGHALPHLRAASRRHPDDRVLHDQVRHLRQWRARQAPDERAAPPSAAPEPAPQPSYTVMVVDDSPTVRRLVRSTLEGNGYRVVDVASGIDALSHLSEEAPDLVLLDITMPRLDGYQLCGLIKNHPGTADVPVVMLSGRKGFVDKVRGRMAGSTHYITKPFSPPELLQVIDRLLTQR